MDIFIGIDGGGTKTAVRIENAAGDLLGESVAGPANIRLSVDDAWQSIYHGVTSVLKQHDLSLDQSHHRFHGGFGLAGIEIESALHHFSSRTHLFASVKIQSDAHVACLGAHDNQDGAIIIVGTGAVGYKIEKGKTERVSGWGFPHDDQGSGARIGLSAVELTLQCLDKRIDTHSSMTENLFNSFDRDRKKLVAWANQATSSDFSTLARFVIEATNDPLAVSIMRDAAEAADRMYHALTQLSDRDDLPCCLLGGLSSFVEPYISEPLRSCLKSKKHDAAVGAILMIRNQFLKG